jgi:hypothetical protein
VCASNAVACEAAALSKVDRRESLLGLGFASRFYLFALDALIDFIDTLAIGILIFVLSCRGLDRLRCSCLRKCRRGTAAQQHYRQDDDPHVILQSVRERKQAHRKQPKILRKSTKGIRPTNIIEEF